MDININDVRAKITERWTLMTKLGGEWNAGYLAGLDYALEAVFQLVRQEERREQAQITHPSAHEFNWGNWKEKVEEFNKKSAANTNEKKCGGKDCPCNKQA